MTNDAKLRYLTRDHGCHHHRSGLEYALRQLDGLTHPDGILFDPMIENTFAWDTETFRSRLPHREPWVGWAHNPPNMPTDFFPEACPQYYCGTELFRQSLANCRGLFASSEYQAQWFRRLGVPVDVVLHPTDLDVPQFSWDAYCATQPRRLLHIGWWLRRFRSFSSLSAPGHRKVLLKLRDANALNAMRSLDFSDIDIVSYQPNAGYDELLRTSVVFADLIDSSANNVVLDCAARATPLVVNRHAAVEEYLGAGYPLFYESLDEAASLLGSEDALLSGHRYLSRPELRQRYSGERFSQAVRESSIYRALPDCA